MEEMDRDPAVFILGESRRLGWHVCGDQGFMISTDPTA
jgi:hypothetical protein